MDLVFKWQYGDENRQLLPIDEFRLEFSKTPDFSGQLVSRFVRGDNQASLNAAKSNEFYYRVRGPNGAVSDTESFTFVRMLTPQIVRPTANSVAKVPYLGQRNMEFEVRRDSTMPMVWTQIAT